MICMLLYATLVDSDLPNIRWHFSKPSKQMLGRMEGNQDRGLGPGDRGSHSSVGMRQGGGIVIGNKS